MLTPAVPPTTTDPLHDASGPTTLWTRVNAAEAMPGVLTPLGWTFWIGPSEVGARRGFTDMGIRRPDEIRYPEPADDRLMGIFFGRFALNVEQLRAIADLMPGTTADALEAQLMGSARPGAVSHPSRRRYHVMAGKLPLSMARLPRRANRVHEETVRWWQKSVAAQAEVDEAGARAALADALLTMEQAVRLHCVSTFVCQALYETLRKLAVSAGCPGAETTLTTGYGGMAEIGLQRDLWAVSRNGMTLDAFLHRHGYHGPAEGELSSRSWREDPRPLETAVDGYRRMPDDRAPDAAEVRRAAERQGAERALLAGLPAPRRPAARAVLRLGRRYIPLRELTKSVFLLPFDAGRAAARALGAHLATRGVLADPEEVFLFTTGELLGAFPSDPAGVVAERRRRREAYLALQLPDAWVGPATSIAPPPVEPSRHGDRLCGIAASPGVYEGPVRVVRDPAEAEFDPGDVLVCETTDPSWSALFLLAGAVVTDIGGAISHGAIVAREMGLPCVVNTRVATSALSTGQRVRVDGAAGEVDVVDATGR